MKFQLLLLFLIVGTHGMHKGHNVSPLIKDDFISYNRLLIMEICLFSNFRGFIVNNIKCVNDGDVAQFYVCKELVEKKILPQNGAVKNVYVDIGAYVGAWTSMISALTHSTAEIHAYEPGKQHYKLLEENCRNLQNIHMNNYGIGETEAEVRLIYTGGGGHFQSSLDDLSQCLNTEMIQTKPFNITAPIHIMKIDVDGYECKLLPTLYPFLYLIHSLICEMDIYDYSANRQDCIAIATPILEKLISHFPYTFGLSRHGAPYCVEIKQENIKDWIEDHYDNHLSTDLLFTHHKIGSITCVKYVKNMWYA